MKILVCGGRDYDDRGCLESTLERYFEKYGSTGFTWKIVDIGKTIELGPGSAVNELAWLEYL